MCVCLCGGAAYTANYIFIPRENESGRGRYKHAFINFEDPSDTIKAVSMLHNSLPVRPRREPRGRAGLVVRSWLSRSSLRLPCLPLPVGV